ncbi:mRNA turnover protein 4 homolog [Artemia franciscana]|uniref:Ribosome assembly factor mrt4 n=1 Tax=Artemia franciscana TaxID=6661 RepID=A0AA88H8W8_ARTSF|nr:hypothetical protein QYM36_016816 [Artemia franciscana]
MPKSKRYKKISLTQTKKKNLEWKQEMVDNIRSSVESYKNIFIFSLRNTRNSQLKQLRNKWKDSRFFLGKNRVMALALGRHSEDEVQENLHKVSKLLKGQCGLLFTNRSKEEVSKFFEDYVESDYARSGTVAPITVQLSEGPLEQFPFNLEPQLRQLGLPTSLKRGVIHLIKDFVVCKKGKVINCEQARILKHLGQKLAEFRVVLEARWSKGGEFEDYFEGSRDDGVNKPIEDIMEQGDSGSDFEENRDDEEENVRKPTDKVMEKADSGSDFEE